MDLFQEKAPEVAKAFDGLITSIVASKGLGWKDKATHLLCIESVSR